MPEFCKVEREGHLFIVTMNRPEVMNSLHPPANFELEAVFDDFVADPGALGRDHHGRRRSRVLAPATISSTRRSHGGRLEINPKGFAGLTARYDNPKPVIAAVNGVAMGGGFEIALACDIIVASEKAVFALPEPRVGLAALAGGMHRLPRAIPLKHAMGMLLTGRRVSAEEGYRLGFVNEVVPDGEALAGARRWADQILECAPLSVRASKQSAYRGPRQGRSRRRAGPPTTRWSRWSRARTSSRARARSPRSASRCGRGADAPRRRRRAPWTTLDRVASAGGELELRARGEREFLITVAGRVLMTSAAHGSESALARVAVRRPRGAAQTARADRRPRHGLHAARGARRAAARRVGARARARAGRRGVVSRARSRRSPAARSRIRASRWSWPTSETRCARPRAARCAPLRCDRARPVRGAARHARRGGPPALGRVRARGGRPMRSRRGGALGVWCEEPAPGFARRLARVGLSAQMRRAGRGGRRHALYLARRPLQVRGRNGRIARRGGAVGPGHR